MPERVTFEKVKSNGSVVKKQVPVFQDGDWKEWLEWLLKLSEYFVFMGYSHSEQDQLDFVEDVQVLLQDEDLLMFNDFVADDLLTNGNVAIQALRQLTTVHCPPGTRALIMGLSEMPGPPGPGISAPSGYSSDLRSAPPKI